MSNFLTIPYITDYTKEYYYSFDRDLKPGDTFIIKGTPAYTLSAKTPSSSKDYRITISTDSNDYSPKSVTHKYTYGNDHSWFIVINDHDVIAPMGTEGNGPSQVQHLGDKGSTNLSEYNCTLPIVELSTEDPNQSDFVGTLDGVTEYTDGLIFLAKIPAAGEPGGIADASIYRYLNINDLGKVKLMKFDINYEASLRFRNYYDKFFPVIYYNSTFFAITTDIETTHSGETV